MLTQREDDGNTQQYTVYGVYTWDQRTAIVGTGAAIDAVGDTWITVSATLNEIEAIEALGYSVERIDPPFGPLDFPPEDSDYHDYTEMVIEINQAAADHPGILNLVSIGQSYEGRELWMAKISDHPTLDETEPEILFTIHQHASEHLAVEQGLYLLHILTDEYGLTPQITDLVDTREIYILFDTNPDGGEYDHATGSYASWRKNRQPNDGSSYIGTDLNRNWSYQWGCCGGSSGDPSSSSYRGSSPFSAPETDAVHSFVASREIDEKQQITAHIDFHTYGEFIYWPYSYTDYPSPDMTADDHDVFVTMAQNMAALNGYVAMKSGSLYPVDGSIIDWMYGTQHIFSFIFELANSSYPPDEIIPTETARNREALLYFIELADCPYRAVGKEADYCLIEPIVGLTAANDSPTPVGAATTLSASITSGSNVSYTWNFGDGGLADDSGPVVNHIYPGSGSYTAMVTASNSVNTDSTTTTVIVEKTIPIAAFSSSSPDMIGEVTAFDNHSVGGDLGFEWDFGDGSSVAASTNPTHTYATAGIFTATLTANNSLGSDTSSAQVVIQTLPPQLPSLRGYWSLDETNGQRKDGSGRDNHLTDHNHVGSAPGQVKLAADLENDNDSYLSIDDTLQNGLDITGSMTLAGWMNTEGFEDTQIIASKYEFGITNRAYRFDLRSSTRLTFIVSPDGNAGDAYRLESNLVSPLNPGTWYHVAAVFDADRHSLAIYLDGDLIASRTVAYDHIYDSSAPFMLGADMSDGSVGQYFDGQLDEWYIFAQALSENEIEALMTLPQQPIGRLAAYNDGPTVLGKATVLSATITSGSGITYSWYFGDGSESETSVPVVSHTYAGVSTFTATVTASNSINARQSTTTVIIQDVPPMASFTTSSPDTLGETTVLTNTSTGSNLGFIWDFGDGSPVATGIHTTHTFTATGTFTVTLTATNSVGWNIASAQVVVAQPGQETTFTIYVPVILVFSHK
ncbi:MAG: PKD domain-containing protein [Anaerolineae bacterium]|nr:PKD domain-containing protein [Anaerolineae bacterium]